MGWNQEFGLCQFKYRCPDWQLDIKGERHKFKVLRLNDHRGEERPEDGVPGHTQLKVAGEMRRNLLRKERCLGSQQKKESK